MSKAKRQAGKDCGGNRCSVAFYDGFFQAIGIMGAASAIGVRAVQITYYSELTEAQALIKFFPLWGMSVAFALMSFLWFRGK